MILHASMMDMVPTMIMMLKVCNTYHKCIYIYICVCVYTKNPLQTDCISSISASSGWLKGYV